MPTMGTRDLFSHLNRFDGVLDDEEQDIFDTAELVMAEYTGGHLSESEARARLRHLLDEQGQLPYLQAPPDIHARAGD
jgi:hypothetical protein